MLGELLGSEHDLGFLRTRLEKESGDEALARELAQLQKLITKRCKRLRRDAVELGRRFYADHLMRSQNASPSSPANERKNKERRSPSAAAGPSRGSRRFSLHANQKIFRPLSRRPPDH